MIFYWDDLKWIKICILVKIKIFFSLIGKRVVLVDDVIYKGCIIWVVFNVVIEYGCF